MDKLKLILVALGVVGKLVEAKQDDGKIDAGEVVEIVLSSVGSALGADGDKLTAWVKATEDLIGAGLLSKTIGLIGDKK